ncbi:spore germination protein KA [Shouchella lonarensis]|uniref:Spore germination protein KA n=2 Tax=Shouchella lonarensis TaxID=1464122 RepID=A0A1G6KQX5_9BACI|nr:spore germination protein KA [Shouchella lonarensis]
MRGGAQLVVKKQEPAFDELSLDEKIAKLQEVFEDDSEFHVRHVKKGDLTLTFACITSLVSMAKINDFLIPTLMRLPAEEIDTYVHNLQTIEATTYDDAINQILAGSVMICVGDDHFYTVYLKEDTARDITEPNAEQVVHGSHEGFVEDLQTNVRLVRNRVRSRHLKVEHIEIGTETKTKVAIVYMKDLVNEDILAELKRRMNYIETDMVVTTNYLEEFIEDSPFSIFPQMISTERPDKVEANLLDGKIALLSDGGPNSLIMPVTFFSFFQSPDDYNSRWMTASFIRMLRFVSFLIAIILPALYIAVVSFHFEVLPDELVMPLKLSVSTVPYPPIMEALLMELTIELIREAGIRLPSPISQTIGIVGGLVIGDAVVQAGLVSNVMIIVVAITAIASYIIPSNEFSASIRLLRFPIMLLAAMFGFIGIIFGLIIMLMQLCKQESFGVAYFYPIAPFKWNGLKDAFIRVPLWLMKRRPLDAKPKKRFRFRQTRGWDIDGKS